MRRSADTQQIHTQHSGQLSPHLTSKSKERARVLPRVSNCSCVEKCIITHIGEQRSAVSARCVAAQSVCMWVHCSWVLTVGTARECSLFTLLRKCSLSTAHKRLLALCVFRCLLLYADAMGQWVAFGSSVKWPLQRNYEYWLFSVLRKVPPFAVSFSWSVRIGNVRDIYRDKKVDIFCLFDGRVLWSKIKQLSEIVP